MKQKIFVLTALILFSAVVLYVSCCEDCPTCPDEPTPGSYYVYIADDNQGAPAYIWVVDSRSDSLIDSILTPDDNITVMDISPDGRYLAVLAIAADSVFVFDLETKAVLISLPGGFPFFTPDNAHLLIGDIHTEILYKYDIPHWSLAATDTIPFAPYGLFNHSPYIFGSNTGKEYYIYDYQSMSLVKTDSLKRADGSKPQALGIITSSDDRYFYFLARPNKIFRFELESDSIVDSINIIYGAYCGELECTPDGKYLLLSESNQWPDPLHGSLLIIDQASFTVHRRIPTWGLNPHFPGAPASIGQIAITADGSKVFSARNQIGVVPPLSFNLLDLSGAFIEGLTANCSAIAVATGKQIEK